MARELRQSTSVDVPIGPFLDDTDGKTPETALTITQPDVRLKKNAGNWAPKAAAQTLLHEENGNYEVTLDATDTDTLGQLRLHVNEAGALPVWEDFLVVSQAYWDEKYSTGVPRDAAGVTTLLARHVGTLAAGTHNPQSGDNYARLGAPAGASVSADVAAVKVDTGAVKLKTDNLPSGIQKNTPLANFEFLMVDSTDHITPKTLLTVTAQRSIDGAAFAACANAVTEVAVGIYKINLAASDLNGDVITLRFTATGADARLLTIVTEP